MFTYFVLTRGSLSDAIVSACEKLGFACETKHPPEGFTEKSVILESVAGNFEKHRILCCSLDKQQERRLHFLNYNARGFLVAVNAEYEVAAIDHRMQCRITDALRELNRRVLKHYRLANRPVGKRTERAMRHRLQTDQAA